MSSRAVQELFLLRVMTWAGGAGKKNVFTFPKKACLKTSQRKRGVSPRGRKTGKFEMKDGRLAMHGARATMQDRTSPLLLLGMVAVRSMLWEWSPAELCRQETDACVNPSRVRSNCVDTATQYPIRLAGVCVQKGWFVFASY